MDKPAEEQLDILGDKSYSNDLADHLGEIPEEVKKKWPRDLIALIDIFSAALERMGYKGNEAQKISLTLLYEQSMYCGGRYFYLPKKDGLQKAIRDIDLHRDWAENSVPPSELAAKYKISVQHVYRIIEEQRAYYRKKVQPELF